MKYKAILAVALMLVMAFAVSMPVDESDATIQTVTIDEGKNISVTKGSTVTLNVTYKADRNDTVTVGVYSSSDTKNPIVTQKESILSGEYTFQIQFSTEDVKEGKMYLDFGSAYSKVYFDLSYKTSIWSNWTTYMVIIVIIILVVAVILFKSRMAPKQKNQMTFEQIEAQKQAEKTAPKKEKAAPVKSERQRYLESKKK
ncbi:MAG: hypothetical protein J5813_01630 [Candidatus Methanomethylophilaceae archaeon]|nr:hypothetical protein [Candidatus Methanomethylophilaceae archaeon]